ncbi:hypothetical protein BAE44_0026441 [Dichanthelium oligosanthes]|uniref:Uncharacterized protein n=1 Tax=Dichanthelium oligosanthes TaxID=888268 RepID=A0A1E5UI48_9POAL|nr:hypothetical protein BAE44_0026441 [Dichanthelium oligosanthes]
MERFKIQLELGCLTLCLSLSLHCMLRFLFSIVKLFQTH